MIYRLGIFFGAVLFGAWLLIFGGLGEGGLLVLALAAGLSALVAMVDEGPAWAIALFLPVAVLTNFVDVPLNGRSFLFSPRAAYLLVLCLVLGARMVLQRRPLQIPAQARPLLILLGALVLTVPFSQAPLKSLAYFFKTSVMVGALYLFCLEAFENPQGRRTIERTLVGLAAVVFLFGLYQFATQSLGYGEIWRSRETIEELRSFKLLRVPSVFATTYVTSEFYFLLIPFFLIRSEGAEGQARHLWRGAIALLVVGIVLTQQRSGIAIALFEVIAFKLMEGQGRFINRLVQVTLVTCLLGVGLYVVFGQTNLGQGLLERMKATLAANSVGDIQDAGSTVVRLERIYIAWLIFKDHMLTGVGLGLSPVVYPGYGWAWIQFDGGAHNVYLYFLCESGIVGFLGLLYCFKRYLQMAAEQFRQAMIGDGRRHWAAGLVFTVALLLDGFFSGLWAYPSMVFIVIGLAYVHSRPDQAVSKVPESPLSDHSHALPKGSSAAHSVSFVNPNRGNC